MPLADAPKPRPRRELIMIVIQPLALVLIRLLAPLRLNPLYVVLAHGLIGFLAAFLIAPAGQFLAAALLLQVKTLLDNVDGGLARATGQVTLMGRYFDTVMDFFVNVALFAALAAYGSIWLLIPAFLILSFILSLDYKLELAYQQLRRPEPGSQDIARGASQALYNFFKNTYELVFSPQDRLIDSLEAQSFKRVSGLDFASAPLDIRLAWNDMFSTASIVNLGLSSQFLLLGILVFIEKPFWYVISLFVQALYVLCLQLLRYWRFRRYLQNRE